MAKLIPLSQTFVDLRNGEQVGVTRVRLSTNNAEFCTLPQPIKDAVVLGGTVAERKALGFYLGGGAKANTISIDNGTAGQEVLIVSRHGGFINYGSE